VYKVVTTNNLLDSNSHQSHKKLMAAKILVVENETLSLKSTSQILREKGYEVDEASDGEQALALLNEQRFDLVITEFILPRLNGLKLVDRIQSKWPQIPVIFSTAYLSLEPAKQILGRAAEVLPKPVKADELLSTIQRLLGSKLFFSLCSPAAAHFLTTGSFTIPI
jgi:CheY-like chemotaxis protein